MKIVIPGGTGQVGTLLARAFSRDGHEVVVLSRNPESKGGWRTVSWDSVTLGKWSAELEGADLVINLAGRNVNCRYTADNRAQIMDSRVYSTRLIGAAIERCKDPPGAWFQASTATIYAHRFDAPNDEATGILGGSETHLPSSWRFSLDVATSWERAANEAKLGRTRRVLLRSAITLNPDHGSAFDILLRLVRLGLGGQAGNGLQYVSWIHETDFISAIYWLVQNDSIDGVVNVAAPNPVPNRDFMRILREEWGTKIGLPSPQWLLEFGAYFIRTETELLLKSRRVVPGRLLERGFTFEFPFWSEAARDLCSRWRELNGKETSNKPLRESRR